MTSAVAPRVALLSLSPVDDEGKLSLSLAPYVLQATLQASPLLQGVEARVIEPSAGDVDELAARLEDFAPDVVAVSAYVWSFPTLVDVARRLRRSRPQTLVVFGGPSARPGMFALEKFADASCCVDALVIGEGEAALVDIVASIGCGRHGLLEVDGILVSTADGWRPTRPRTDVPALDDLPSPYQAGLVPPSRSGRLETYRGCRVGCAFCQVPNLAGQDRVHSAAFLTRELAALRRARCDRVFLIDAAFNLNARAFESLNEAERDVGLFQELPLDVEVFPSRLTPAHLDFLHRVRTSFISIGVQSFSRRALAFLRRPFDEQRLERLLGALAGLNVGVELILGLPFDEPRRFLEGLDRMVERGHDVLVSHCLVLPDTPLSRASAEARLQFDEDTLKVTSCAGWPAEALRETGAAIDQRVASAGGQRRTFSWRVLGSSSSRREPAAPDA